MCSARRLGQTSLASCENQSCKRREAAAILTTPLRRQLYNVHKLDWGSKLRKNIYNPNTTYISRFHIQTGQHYSSRHLILVWFYWYNSLESIHNLYTPMLASLLLLKILLCQLRFLLYDSEVRCYTRAFTVVPRPDVYHKLYCLNTLPTRTKCSHCLIFRKYYWNCAD